MASVSLLSWYLFCHRYVLFDGEFLVRKHICSWLRWENAGCITIGLFQRNPTGKECPARLATPSRPLSTTDVSHLCISKRFSDFSAPLLASFLTAERCGQDPGPVESAQRLDAAAWKEMPSASLPDLSYASVSRFRKTL